METSAIIDWGQLLQYQDRVLLLQPAKVQTSEQCTTTATKSKWDLVNRNYDSTKQDTY